MEQGAALPPGMFPQQGFIPAGPPHAGYQAVPAVQMFVVPPLQDAPGRAVCPHCQQAVTTITEHKSGSHTWALCIVLTFFGLCCIPFCCDSCKDVEHSCPSCRKVIQVHKRGNSVGVELLSALAS